MTDEERQEAAREIAALAEQIEKVDYFDGLEVEVVDTRIRLASVQAAATYLAPRTILESGCVQVDTGQ